MFISSILMLLHVLWYLFIYFLFFFINSRVFYYSLLVVLRFFDLHFPRFVYWIWNVKCDCCGLTTEWFWNLKYGNLTGLAMLKWFWQIFGNPLVSIVQFTSHLWFWILCFSILIVRVIRFLWGVVHKTHVLIRGGKKSMRVKF